MNHIDRDQLLQYVRSLANRETNAIGFLPDTVYAPALESGRLIIARENKEPCGFILHGPANWRVRIYQTAVDPQVRMANHGRELFLHSLLDNLQANVEQIDWICAEDLPANKFWQRVSQAPHALTKPERQSKRPRFHYRYQLPRGKELEAYLDAQLYESTAFKIATICGCPEVLERAFKKRFRATR